MWSCKARAVGRKRNGLNLTLQWGNRHTHRYSVSERCWQERIDQLSRCVPSACQTMNNEFIEGDEGGA